MKRRGQSADRGYLCSRDFSRGRAVAARNGRKTKYFQRKEARTEEPRREKWKDEITAWPIVPLSFSLSLYLTSLVPLSFAGGKNALPRRGPTRRPVPSFGTRN